MTVPGLHIFAVPSGPGGGTPGTFGYIQVGLQTDPGWMGQAVPIPKAGDTWAQSTPHSEISLQSGPTQVAAAGRVVKTITLQPPNGGAIQFKDIEVFVTNLDGSQTWSSYLNDTLTKDGSEPDTKLHGDDQGFAANATVVGGDLSWNEATVSVESAAGGTFFVTLIAQVWGT